MKRLPSLLLLFTFVSLALTLTAQVAVNENGDAPDGSAMLDISSTEKGILIPRMTQSDRDAISLPATGLMVFTTEDNRFWVYNGSSWEKVLASADGGWIVSGDNAVTAVTGNVGIGTTSPGYDLEVANAGSYQYESTTIRLSLYSDGADAKPGLSIIRTHSPVLGDVSSAAAVTQDGDNLGRISFGGVRINGSGGSQSGAGWLEMIQRGASVSSGVPGQMQFATSDGQGDRSTRMVISPTGYVGIGTTSPVNPLHVFSQTGAALKLQGDDGWIGMQLSDGSDNITSVQGFMNQGNGETSLDIANWKPDGMISFYTSDQSTRAVTAKMVLMNDGCLGIGNSSPDGKLIVTSNSDTLLGVMGDRLKTTTGGLEFLNSSADPVTSIQNGLFRPQDNTLGLATNFEERLRILPDGRIGIGTIDPVGDLEIARAGSNQYESTDFRVSLFADGTNASPRFTFVRSHSPVPGDDTSSMAVTQDGDILGRLSFSGMRINGPGGSLSGAGWFEMVQAGPSTSDGVPGQFQVITADGLGNRTERFVVSPTGQVGIGTTTPNAMLDVEGDLDMNGNQVKNFRIENRTSDPSSPAVGQIWMRTDL